MNKKIDNSNAFYEDEKPPLGIPPRHVGDLQRGKDILAAMERYAKKELAVPVDWVDELHEIVDRLEKRYLPTLSDRL